MKPGSLLTLPQRPYSVGIEARETLPFRVRLVDSTQDLIRAVEIRASAFARHVPSLGASLSEPEADDHRPDVLLLIVERKADGRVLGTMRLQPNTFRPLRVEGEARLPFAYQDARLFEFMRLGVENGIAGRMVMAALCKAGYEISFTAGFDYIFAVGRRSTSEMYRSMHFDDVFAGATVPISYAEGRLHSIFALPVSDADRRWRSSNHSLYSFMARTEHPDIQIDYDRVLSAFGQP